MDAIRDLSRAGCLHLDQQDALSSFRENFLLCDYRTPDILRFGMMPILLFGSHK